MRWSILVIFLLFVPAVMAVTVSVSPTTFGPSDSVTINIDQCSGNTLVTVVDPRSQAVFSSLVSGKGTTTYHTSSSILQGNFTVSASCGSDIKTTKFTVSTQGPQSNNPAVCGNGVFESGEGCDDGNTVNGDGCSASCKTENGWSCANKKGVKSTCTKSPAQPQSSGGGGGGGSFRCNPKWECSDWGLCNASLEQTRRCLDQELCEFEPRYENRSCPECDESWICSGWSECSNGVQTRSCSDDQQCGTAKRKPSLQRVCNEAVPGFVPSQTDSSLPPPNAGEFRSKVEKSFWDTFKVPIILSIVVVLAAIAILVTVLVLKKHRVVSNLDELKEWIKTEMKMGTSKEKAIKILHEQSGWRDSEINRAFSEIGKGSV